MPDPWPLRHLVLRTPRLELRPDDDAGLRELACVAQGGIHRPAEMPFAMPWTDQPPDELARGTLQYHWGQRAQLGPAAWSLHFLVRHEGRVVGTQSLAATAFAVTRAVSTGSWLGAASRSPRSGTCWHRRGSCGRSGRSRCAAWTAAATCWEPPRSREARPIRRAPRRSRRRKVPHRDPFR